MPSFTFYATAEATIVAGATPVFCDIDLDTFCVTPETVKAVLTPRTKAIVPVHLFGNVAPVPALREFGLPVLEDAAQAAGADLDGVKAGALGDAATFSFFPSKNLPCLGDGGAITTNSDEVAELGPGAALPRLARQEHVRRGGLQLAPRRYAGGGAAGVAARARRLERAAAARSRRGLRAPGPGRARGPARRRPAERSHSTTSMSSAASASCRWGAAITACRCTASPRSAPSAHCRRPRRRRAPTMRCRWARTSPRSRWLR